MTYILFLIVLNAGGIFTATEVETFTNMTKCFEGREILVESIGRPIKNYQAVCVIKD